MNKKIWKLLKRKSEKERERDKIISNLISCGCTAGFLAAGFIGGIIIGISEKLNEGEELKINWKKIKEISGSAGWISIGILVVISAAYSYYWYKNREVSKELENIQEKLEDELDDLE